MKMRAFTLAETLIVIGIIGVVAALTLPNLNHATGDKEKVTKVKKIYSALTDAFDRAQAIYGPFDEWVTDLYNSNGYISGSNIATASERFAKRVTEFMKVSKDCRFDEGCFSTAPLLLSDGEECEDDYLKSLQSRNTYMVVLQDGVSLGFDVAVSRIRVDIDGPNKGKNQEGSDIFDFGIYYYEDDWTTDAGVSVNQLYPSTCPNCWTGNLDGYTQYETAWVIQNGNLDYLKCLMN